MSDCVHHFVIPSLPEPPVGRCRKCGVERAHQNVASVNQTDGKSLWRRWRHQDMGETIPERLIWRMPPGFGNRRATD